MEELTGKPRLRATRQLRKLEAAMHKAKARMDYKTMYDLTQEALKLRAHLEVGGKVPAIMARD